jgi:ComF family protein
MSLLRTIGSDWLRGPCPACAGPGGAPLCRRCRADSGTAQTGLRGASLEGMPLRFLASYWDRTSLPPRRTPAAACLFRFKHAGDRYGGRCLARVFAEAAAGFASRFDAVVAVPPSPRRARARGHDPAAWLARHVSRRAGVPVRSGILERCEGIATQRGLTGSARRTNVRGAFRICGRTGPGYSLLLIDDVCTTGSTLLEAAAVLLEAGASAVAAAVLACADDALCLQCPTSIDDAGRSGTFSRAR